MCALIWFLEFDVGYIVYFPEFAYYNYKTFVLYEIPDFLCGRDSRVYKLSLLFAKYLFHYVNISFFASYFFAIFVIPKEVQDKKHHDLVRGEDFSKIQLKSKLLEKLKKESPALYLGADKYTKKGVSLSIDNRNKHLLCSGPTGAGKTESVFYPLIEDGILSGGPVIIIDGKGGKKGEAIVRTMVKRAGREKDFKFFSISNPESSSSYCTFLNGDPIDQKDQMMGSIVWSEPFYRSVSEKALLLIFNVFKDQGIIPSFDLLETAFTDPFHFKFKNFKNPLIEERFKHFCLNFKKDKDKYSNVLANISSLSAAYFGNLFDNCDDGINLLDAYDKNQILYFQLPASRYEETVKRIGRLLLYDLKAVCSKIEDRPMFGETKFCPVIIDEADKFLNNSFKDLLLRARSAGVGISAIIHSISELDNEDFKLKRAILQNVNCMIVMKQNDHDDRDQLAKDIGTFPNYKYTFKTDTGFLGNYLTGEASKRQVNSFLVSPNELKELRVGHALVMVSDENRIHRTQFYHKNFVIDKNVFSESSKSKVCKASSVDFEEVPEKTNGIFHIKENQHD